MSTLAAGVVVYRLTDSALNVGLLMIATVLPSLCVGALAGGCVDRGDRRRIMLAADLLRAALMLSIPFLIGWSVAWLYVVIVLINATSQFFNAANASLSQETVTDEELPAANAWTAISTLGAP